MSKLFSRTVVLTNHGIKELKDINLTEDMIWDGSNYRPVENIFSVKSESAHVINFGKGNVIKCDGDTIFYSNGKPIAAKDITSKTIIDNIDCSVDKKPNMVVADNRINNMDFALIYGIYICSCKNVNNKCLLTVNSKNAILEVTRALNSLGLTFSNYNIGKDRPNDNQVCFEIEKNSMIAAIKNFKLYYMHGANTESYMMFLRGILASRGFINIDPAVDQQKTFSFDLRFSTNNEKIAYGVQFELFKRFNIRSSVRLSRNSAGNKTFKCTITGSKKLLSTVGEKWLYDTMMMLDTSDLSGKCGGKLDWDSIKANVDLKDEYEKSEVIYNKKVCNKTIDLFGVKQGQGKTGSIEIEQPIPICGYIKVNF